tara:strand:+ start:383 stop:781 length:399 start_codon:yes stop_codon:yes gene_type:complete
MGKSKESLIDVWALAHIFVGAVICTIGLLWTSPVRSFFIVLIAAILFEIFENSSYGIACSKRFACICPGESEYGGDNFWNSVADIIFNMIGWNIVSGVYDPTYWIGGFVWASVLSILIVGWYLQDCDKYMLQ